VSSTSRAGRAFAVGLVAFLFIALPLGALVGAVLHALGAHASIVGTLLDLTVLLPAIVLFGVPGVGIYALVLGIQSPGRPLSTAALIAYLPLVATGWFGIFHLLPLSSVAFGGTLVATLVVFVMLMVLPFRRHLL
jgi:hypothetical protein